MARKGKVRDRDLGMAKALEQLNRLAVSSVEGGVFEDAPVYPSNGESVAVVAAIHELGLDGFPMRPFIRETMDAQRARYGRMMEQAARVGKPTMLRRVAAALYRDLRKAVKRKGLYRTGHLFRWTRTRVNDGPAEED